MWDHPRIRGEHSVRAAQSRFVKGSSPHTRGARTRRSGASAALGIIPAYAGSTSRRRYSSRGCRDHPRIRGEHSSSLMLGLLPMGSSPHTRGALERSGVAFAPVGIIPAYAGSTSFVAKAARSYRDHPRIRGEHLSLMHGRLRTSGSSPHTRGAHAHGSASCSPTGIIPAYAGSTSRTP